MKYSSIQRGKFLSRPNRFIANVEIDGNAEICHVKNTGRCKELLTAGAEVIVEKSANPLRKTKYDLIAVYKGDMLINMDSQAPNKIFSEWVTKSGFFGKGAFVKPEYTYGSSRLDFFIQSGDRRILVEVKGVTLENDGIVSFPDAPTERGIKHLNELRRAVEEGYEACVFFIVQMERCIRFEPSYVNHREFAHCLCNASKSGVGVYALNCRVTPDSVEALSFVDVFLDCRR